MDALSRAAVTALDLERSVSPRAGVRPTVISMDWHAFPHIIDAIVAVSPHSALLSLRATHSLLRDRVDILLARHVAIENKPACMRSGHGAHPGLIVTHDYATNTFTWTSSPRALILNSVEVLDCMTTHLHFPLIKTLEPLRLPNVHTVRTWLTSSCLDLDTVEPETHVFFAWRRDESPTHPPAKRPLGAREIPLNEFRPNPARLRRLVLNLAADRQNFPPCVMRWFVPDKKLSLYPSHDPDLDIAYIHLQHVVVVFSPLLADVNFATPDPLHYLREMVQLLITAAIAVWERDSRLVKLTFDNAQVVPDSLWLVVAAMLHYPPGKGVDHSPPGAGMVEVLQSIQEGAFDGAREAPFEALTLKEYEDQIGSQQFRLETDEDFSLR